MTFIPLGIFHKISFDYAYPECILSKLQSLKVLMTEVNIVQDVRAAA